MKAVSGTLVEFIVKWVDEKSKDEAGKDRAEGTSLSEAFMLEEVAPRASGCLVPAVIGIGAKKVKAGCQQEKH